MPGRRERHRRRRSPRRAAGALVRLAVRALLAVAAVAVAAALVLLPWAWEDYRRELGDLAVYLAFLFLRATRDVDYLRPLVRHRDISVTVLRRVLDTVDDEDVRNAAESVLPQLDPPAAPTASVFSARELDVLAGVREGLRNKDIARRLGMTDDGVRYHLKNIYRKTGASGRTEALRYVQSVPPSERSPARRGGETNAAGVPADARRVTCASPAVRRGEPQPAGHTPGVTTYVSGYVGNLSRTRSQPEATQDLGLGTARSVPTCRHYGPCSLRQTATTDMETNRYRV